MLIYLAQYLLDNYNVLREITSLVNTTDIWLMPSMNPDGYNRSKVRITFKIYTAAHVGHFFFMVASSRQCLSLTIAQNMARYVCVLCYCNIICQINMTY